MQDFTLHTAMQAEFKQKQLSSQEWWSRNQGSHVRKYFWESKMLEVEHFALKSEVLLFCTEKRET